MEMIFVTLDTMNCQTMTLAKIQDNKADYLVTVKKNQQSLHRNIVEMFEAFSEDNYSSPRCRSHKITRTTRGRAEERIVTVSAAPKR